MSSAERLTHGHKVADFSARTDNFWAGLGWAALGLIVMAIMVMALAVVAIVETQPYAIWQADLMIVLLSVVLGYRFGFRNYAHGMNMLSPRRETTVTGGARMGTKKDLAEAGLIGKHCAKDRIYAGTLDGEDIFSDSERHIGIVGPSGFGKDTGHVFRNLKDCDRPFIVVDPKSAEMASVAARWRLRYGPGVPINPYNIGPPHLKSVGFNPIADLDPDDDNFFADANNIAEAAVPDQDGENKFFVTSARRLISLCIMRVTWMAREPGFGRIPTLADVNRLLMLPHTSADEDAPTLQKAMQKMCSHDDEQISLAAGSFVPNNRTTLSIIETAKDAMNNLNDRCISNDLKKTPIINDKRFPAIHGKPFHFGMLRDYPITVWIMLPENKLVAQATWLRLMVACAINAITKEVPSTKRPVLLVNEAGNLKRLGSLEASMNMGRGKFTVLTIWQHLDQIRQTYGVEGLGNFLQGWGLSVFFACKDPFTADYVSRRVGQTTAYLRSYDAASRLASKGQNDQATGVSLRLPDDLERMLPRKAVIWAEPSVRPFEVDVPCYDSRGLDPSPNFDEKKRR